VETDVRSTPARKPMGIGGSPTVCLSSNDCSTHLSDWSRPVVGVSGRLDGPHTCAMEGVAGYIRTLGDECWQMVLPPEKPNQCIGGEL
jgi:hypothetical protein